MAKSYSPLEGKHPTNAKNFKPISLLCHIYKLFKIMILHRIRDIEETNN